MLCGGTIDIELKELRPDGEMACSKGCVHDFWEINAAAKEVLIQRRAARSGSFTDPRTLFNTAFGLYLAGLLAGFIGVDAGGTVRLFGYQYKPGFFYFLNRDWPAGYLIVGGILILFAAAYLVINRQDTAWDAPLKDGKAGAKGKPGGAGASSASGNDQKILQIDDNPEIMNGVKSVLERAFPGVTVLMSGSGAEGLALALAETPDLILLNIIMPELDALEVCRRLKADDRLKAVPVLFVTSDKTDKESRAKALEAGGYGFLRKPIEVEKLVGIVRYMAKLRWEMQHPEEIKNAAGTHWNWKTYFDPYVIILVSLSPIIIAKLAVFLIGSLGGQASAARPPDIPLIGGLLYSLGMLGWLSAITIPAGALALLVYFILHFTGRLKK